MLANFDQKPRILLVKLSAFGDVIHALPTLEALRAAYPQGRLTWLVEDAFAPLLAGHPALDEVWPVPRLRVNRDKLVKEIPTVARFARRLRSAPFDLVIDLQGLLKSAVWVTLARSPRKVGYNGTRELSYLALTERLAPLDPETHAVQRYLNVARCLGAPVQEPRFHLDYLISALPPDVQDILGQSRIAVLHPGARWATKLWPTQAWARLAEWLAQDKGLNVLITGSSGDRELAAAITRETRAPVINLAGRTSISELAALLRQAVFAVTTDTGPMHLAAALGTPVAALFGPTAPWRTGPFGEGHEILSLGLECSPCFKRECSEPRCLLELKLEEVQRGCEKILSRQGIT